MWLHQADWWWKEWQREREREVWARHNKSEKNAGKPLYPLSRTCGFFFFISLCRTYSQENISYLKNISNKWNTAVLFLWTVDRLRSTVLLDDSFGNANNLLPLLNKGTTKFFFNIYSLLETDFMKNYYFNKR